MSNIDAFIKLFAAIAAMILVGFLLSYPAMLLWNECLVPAVPVFQSVSWLQMWGITILFSLIAPKTVYSSNK
jgi:ABC-type anion transport system duplicated permease subunit